MNGQITKVKQTKTKANFKMGDHLESTHFVFFTLAMISRNTRQICQILLVSWSSGKKLNCCVLCICKYVRLGYDK